MYNIENEFIKYNKVFSPLSLQIIWYVTKF